ncbi:hypothetical protein GOBAR_AA30553 [Gossypium barbadense]|uniref:Uncharacterized protein n=1 Tax=Gossypium barbadense TaxID=3634 RepID=A0A2P5WGB5_GOSBA|nr:hypothetical protein GOBAR_DD35683 [Gossypium barbadense]PPR90137.1 hypothetical protein GOBAR_AA30553 [Gossypium barbadense]
MMFNKSIKIEELKARISGKIIACCGTLFYRLMISSNPIVYAPIELVEDVVETMMATHSSFENNAVELYAPLGDVEQGNIDITLVVRFALGYIEKEEETRDANTNVTELSDPDRDEEVDATE